MRAKKAAINTFMSLVEEITAIVCAFILPRLILSAFGSKYNGLTTSITQFLACAVLLRCGIGGATRVALYKPLAEHNYGEISSIVKATDIFMKKTGLILAGSIIAFAAIYPFLLQNQFTWFFSFSLFIIIGINTFANSFFGITYFIVLQADQKLWVSSLLQSICYVLNTFLTVLLILIGCKIHMVKLGSTVIYLIYPLVLSWYVKRKYKIDKKAIPNNKAISQRWDAFWHQVSVFVMDNTDVMVLTAFTNMLEVSVYSVYNLVTNGLKRAISCFSNGIEAAFGNMIAKKEISLLKENVSLMELILYSISTITHTSAILLVLQFVGIYTKGISDVNYIRPIFAYILLIAQFFNSVRIPYQLVVQAAGHYKQTKKGAIIEPIINISASIALVVHFGLVGVAIGTLIATIFRTVQFSLYMSKNILYRSSIIALLKCTVSLGEGLITILVVKSLSLHEPTNYLSWCFNALVTVMVTTLIVVLGAIIFYQKDSILLVKKLKNIIVSRKKKYNE